jgi:hypothetical protein
MFYWLFF